MSKTYARFVDSDIRKLLRNVSKYQDDVKKEVKKAVADGAFKVHSDVVKSIQNPSVSGRSYKVGNVTRVASAPGSPPNSQTGDLAKSYKIKVLNKGFTALVYSNSKYARPLEFGTTKMAARPHLYKNFNKHREAIKKSIKRALSKK